MAISKLPVTTIKLKARKIIGLVMFILVNLMLAIFFFRLGYSLVKSPGRFLCLLMFLSSLTLTIFGIIGMVFLFREKFTGIFISGDGMNDISTGHNYGVVMWKDVTKIKIMTDLDKIQRNYIVLKVRNPQEYIDRETSGAKKRTMILKLHYYGSPICFSNRGLKCTFDELEETIKKYYDNYLQRMEWKKANNADSLG